MYIYTIDIKIESLSCFFLIDTHNLKYFIKKLGIFVETNIIKEKLHRVLRFIYVDVCIIDIKIESLSIPMFVFLHFLELLHLPRLKIVGSDLLGLGFCGE